MKCRFMIQYCIVVPNINVLLRQHGQTDITKDQGIRHCSAFPILIHLRDTSDRDQDQRGRMRNEESITLHHGYDWNELCSSKKREDICVCLLMEKNRNERR